MSSEQTLLSLAPNQRHRTRGHEPGYESLEPGTRNQEPGAGSWLDLRAKVQEQDSDLNAHFDEEA